MLVHQSAQPGLPWAALLLHFRRFSRTVRAEPTHTSSKLVESLAKCAAWNPTRIGINDFACMCLLLLEMRMASTLVASKQTDCLQPSIN